MFAEFRDGGPAIARATRALGPFADATEPSLTSLGTAAEQSRQPLLDSVPTLRDAVDLTESAAPGARRLADLLANLRQTGFHEQFMSLLFNTTGAINSYDQYGHFLRAWLIAQQRLHAAQRVPQRLLAQRTSATRPRRPRRARHPGPGSSRPLTSWGALRSRTRRRTREALDSLQGPSSGAGLGRPSPSLAAVRSLLDTMIGRQPQGTGGSR